MRDEIIFPQIIPCDEFKRMKTVTQPRTEEGVEEGVVISSNTWFWTKIDKNTIFSQEVALQC